MKQRRILIAVFGLGLSLVLVLGWIAWSGTRAAAQDTNPKPQGEFTLQRVPESNLNENAALGTAFTYQGYLEDGGKPAAGSYDFQFTPFGAASGGSPVGNTDTHGGVTVTDGLFAVDLDFGSNIFAGEGRWLEIAAKRAADANYTTLSPRQPLRPAPYALYATNADLLDGEHASAFAGASHDHWGATWSGSGRGLFLQSSDHEALHGYTQAGFGAGVVGRNADLGPGGFFSSTLGYGVWSQGAMADVALGGDHGVIASDIFFPQADISLFSHRNVVVHLDEWDDDANACFTIYSGPNSILAQWCEPGMMTSSGLINTVSETDYYGGRRLYAVQSPEVWLEDFGSASLMDGKARVTFEPVFVKTVNLNVDYHVFVTPLCPGPVLLFVTQKDTQGFTVEGETLHGQPAVCGFDYRIVAKRLGYESLRLERTTLQEEGK